MRNPWCHRFTALLGALSFLGMLPAHADPSPSPEWERDQWERNTEGVLSGPPLARFLGPVSPDLFTWRRGWMGLGLEEEYYGVAKPPLSGHVNIIIVLGPVEYAHGPSKPGGPDSVGVLEGYWQKLTSPDGTHIADFMFVDADKNFLRIIISSPVQADAETMAAEISRLGMFNATPETPFHRLVVKRRIVRVICWLLLPGAFAAIVWLADRHARRRRRSGLLRAVIVAAIAALWLGCFIAAVRLTPGGLDSFHVYTGSEPNLLIFVWIAAFCLVAAVFVAVGMMLWRLFRALT